MINDISYLFKILDFFELLSNSLNIIIPSYTNRYFDEL